MSLLCGSKRRSGERCLALISRRLYLLVLFPLALLQLGALFLLALAQQE
jgi:hypothetical protein